MLAPAYTADNGVGGSICVGQECQCLLYAEYFSSSEKWTNNQGLRKQKVAGHTTLPTKSGYKRVY